MNKILLSLPGVSGVTLLAVALAAEDLPDPTTFILPALIILLLVALNGIFVAAEFAINRVRATQLEELVEQGHQTASKSLALLESKHRQGRYIATAQLGISAASLGLGMYGEWQIAHFIEPYLALLMGAAPGMALVHSVASVITLCLLTYAHLVLGEIVPKTIAMNRSVEAILILTGPMQLIEIVFFLPVQILDSIGNLMLKALKLSPDKEDEPLHSPEELEQIVTESAEDGKLTEDEEEMILNIFNFSEREVHQAMTPRRAIQAVPSDISLPGLIELVSKTSFSRFPVYEEDLDHIIGILHLKDLIRQQLRSKGSFDLRLFIRPAHAVPENYPVEQLLNAFKQHRMHMAIVLDEYGGTAGLVTLEDLIEEVVGEVRDEFDRKEKDPLIELGPGSLEVSGRYLLENVQDYVDLGDEDALPDVETVGGLIITLLGRPPQPGDQLVYKQDIKLSVLSIDGLAVGRARIDFPAPENLPEAESRHHLISGGLS